MNDAPELHRSDKQQEPMFTTTVNRDYIIKRLLELPSEIAEASRTIDECKKSLSAQIGRQEQLHNEFTALQVIAKLL